MADYSFEPAIKQPSIVPYLIRGPNAQRFLNDFNVVVDKQYKGNTNLKVLGLRDVKGVPTVVGSNTFVLPVVNSLVSPARRVGMPEDLQRTLNDGDTLDIRGNHYIDLGAVLDFTGRNHDLAVDLYDQIPQIKLASIPSVVVGFGIDNSNKGAWGLKLVYTANTQLRPAQILANGDGRFGDADVSLETGLPSKLGTGNRNLWTAKQKAPSIDNLGLSGLYLVRNLNLGSNNGDLAGSYDYGRVVLF